MSTSMGGDVSADSEQGRGSFFTIRLPAQAANAEGVALNQSDRDDAPRVRSA